jgi:hypothetical protein
VTSPQEPVEPAVSTKAEMPAAPSISARAVDGEREATFDLLIKKQQRQQRVKVWTTSDSGEPLALIVTMRAISAQAYDALLSAHPPNHEQRKNGNQLNVNTFAPALIAACCVTPKMTEEQANELWGSEGWASGEAMGLYLAAMGLCQAGIDVPFNAAD